MKIYDAPLFPGHLFCRFSLILANKELGVLKTPGVILIYPGAGKPQPIPDLEIERLRRITASHYPVECCALPQTGEIVEIPGDIPIRDVLVERGSLCRVDAQTHRAAHRTKANSRSLYALQVVKRARSRRTGPSTPCAP